MRITQLNSNNKFVIIITDAYSSQQQLILLLNIISSHFVNNVTWLFKAKYLNKVQRKGRSEMKKKKKRKIEGKKREK